MNSKLFIGRLSFGTTENTLQDLFAQAGSVLSVNVIQDRSSGKSKGFGFIEMSSPTEASRAIELFDGREVDGRNIVVNEARPREDRPRVGRFGGDRDHGRFEGNGRDRGERRAWQ